jgi:DNA repair exonuclease SbcCD ATPase subunit
MGWAPRGPENQQVSGISFDLPGGESTAAALRRAEQERDEALEEVRVLRHSESLEVLGLHAALAKKLREHELIRAELASARQEIEQLRARPWIVARDANYPCEGCGRIIRRSEAYEYLGADLYQHIHCPDPEVAP